MQDRVAYEEKGVCRAKVLEKNISKNHQQKIKAAHLFFFLKDKIMKQKMKNIKKTSTFSRQIAMHNAMKRLERVGRECNYTFNNDGKLSRVITR